MTRRYDSFMLRCWQLGNEWRIEVEHLQSGERIRSANLMGTAAWIGERCGESGVHASPPQPVVTNEEVSIAEERGSSEKPTDEAAGDAPDRTNTR